MARPDATKRVRAALTCPIGAESASSVVGVACPSPPDAMIMRGSPVHFLVWVLRSGTLEQFEITDTVNGLSRIRESLRKLSDRYREALPKYFNTTIKVSCKHGRSTNRDVARITQAFQNENWNKRLDMLSFEFDLTNSWDLSGYKQLMIHDVGVQVIDQESSLIPTKEDNRPVDDWHVRLESVNNSVPIGGSADAKEYLLPDLIFASVPGDYEGNGVRMSKNTRIQGIDPRRKWLVSLREFSTRGKKANTGEGVFDIVLHFDVIARL